MGVSNALEFLKTGAVKANLLKEAKVRARNTAAAAVAALRSCRLVSAKFRDSETALLVEEVQWAARVKDSRDKHQRPSPAAPPSLQAVQFLFSRKAGLVIGRSAAFGFTLFKARKRSHNCMLWAPNQLDPGPVLIEPCAALRAQVSTNADGSAVWSAPCFLTADSWSVGATIGERLLGA